MGRRGPPRKPTALRILEGNRSNRPLNEREPKPSVGVPGPPKHWAQERIDLWNELGEALSRCGVLTMIDGPALELLVEAYLEHQEAAQKVAKYGPVFIEQGESKIPKFAFSPYWTVANKAAKKLHAMLREFGMTPAARASLITGTPATEASDTESKYFA